MKLYCKTCMRLKSTTSDAISLSNKKNCSSVFTPDLKSQRAGFTLVEVIVGGMIAALTLAAMIISFTIAKRSVSLANNLLSASNSARTVLERLKTYDYDDSTLSIGTHTLTNGFYTVSNNPAFNTTKDITVTIRWREPATAKTQTVSMSTSIARVLHNG